MAEKHFHNSCFRTWPRPSAGSSDNSPSSNRHHRLDHAGFRVHVAREGVDQTGEIGAVGDPRGGVDLAFFDQLDDAGEVGGERVAAGEEDQTSPTAATSPCTRSISVPGGLA